MRVYCIPGIDDEGSDCGVMPAGTVMKRVITACAKDNNRTHVVPSVAVDLH